MDRNPWARAAYRALLRPLRKKPPPGVADAAQRNVQKRESKEVTETALAWRAESMLVWF